MLAGHNVGSHQSSRQFVGQNIVNQTGFAGAGHTADHHKLAQRNGYVNALKVVFARTAHQQRLAIASTAFVGMSYMFGAA